MTLRSSMLACLMTTFAAAGPLASQAAKWRLLETQDELTGASDKRLILRSEGWTPGGATLIVVCGDRIPGAEGRALLLNAGEALQPFGGDALAYAEVSFDANPTRERHYWRLYDGGGARLAHAGDERNPLFAEALFRKLLAADDVEIRYRALGGERSARFDLRGLGPQLRRLTGCTWPDAS